VPLTPGSKLDFGDRQQVAIDGVAHCIDRSSGGTGLHPRRFGALLGSETGSANFE
jgi:hypothetical protein